MTLTLEARSLALTVEERVNEMDAYSRRVVESPLWQGENEQLSYTLTTTNWVSSPTSPVVAIKDILGNDVTAQVMTGSASVSGDNITTPVITGLLKGQRYRVEIKWTVSSRVYEAWFDLYGQE